MVPKVTNIQSVAARGVLPMTAADKLCPKRLASFGYSTLASEEKASEK